MMIADQGGPPEATNRRKTIVIVTAIALLMSGLGLLGLSVAMQRVAPQPAARIEQGAGATGASLGSVSGMWLGSMDRRMNPSPRPADLVSGPTLDRSAPVTLAIPSIGVRSAIGSVGREADGSLEVPASGLHYDEAAWYRHSPTPGSLGPAIVLGHVDSAANGPSVFFRLGELGPGDLVSIDRADGSVAVFVVDRVRRYAKNNFPTGLVYGDIDHAGLRLVTCGGAFDSSSGHYLDNIVVFASLTG